MQTGGSYQASAISVQLLPCLRTSMGLHGSPIDLLAGTHRSPRGALFWTLRPLAERLDPNLSRGHRSRCTRRNGVHRHPAVQPTSQRLPAPVQAGRGPDVAKFCKRRRANHRRDGWNRLQTGPPSRSAPHARTLIDMADAISFCCSDRVAADPCLLRDARAPRAHP
jgi:hypothetical protein